MASETPLSPTTVTNKKGVDMKTIAALIVLLSLLMIPPGVTAKAPSPEQAQKLVEQAGSSEDFGKAKKKLDKALVIYEKLGDLKGRQRVLAALGSLFKKDGRFSEAAQYFKKSAKIAGEIPDPKLEAAALSRAVELDLSIGNYLDALESARRIQAITRQLGEPESEARAENRLGAVLKDSGRYQEAFSHYKKSLKIARRTSNSALEADALGNLGRVYVLSGRYSEAIKSFETLLDVAKKHGARSSEALALINLGNIYREKGRFARASGYLEQALDLSLKTGDPGTELMLLSSLGTLYADWGERIGAMRYYEQALALSKKLKDKKSEARTLTHMGNLLKASSQFRGALKRFSQARKISRELGLDSPDTDKAIGELYLELGETSKADPYLRRSGLDAALGLLFLSQSRFGRAKQCYQRLLQSAEKTENADNLFTAYTGLGRVYEALKDFKNAEKYYVMAMALTEELRGSLLPAARRNFFAARINGFSRSEPAKGLTRVRFKQGLPVKGMLSSELAKARDFADRLWLGPDKGYAGVPRNVQTDETVLLTRLAALRKTRAACPREVNPQRYDRLTKRIAQEEEKLQDFVDMLWKDYAPYAAVKYPKPVDLGELDLGPAGYVLIFDILGEGIGITLLKGRDVIDSRYLEWNASELENAVRKFRRPFELAHLRLFDPELAKDLFTRLLAPILTRVPTGSPLTIIPDGVLAMLPFEALVVRGRARWQTGPEGPFPTGLTYLADIHPVAYQQSLTTLALQQTRRRVKSHAKALLVVADPVFQMRDARSRGIGDVKVAARDRDFQVKLMGAFEQASGQKIQFSRLPETGKLAENLRTLYGEKTSLYCGLKASKRTFLTEVAPTLPDFSYVVIATHGIYSTKIPGLMEPVLTMTMVPPGTDGFLRMTEVMSLDMTADVVAVTACQTALGEYVSGEGIMSMGRAFQYAGARSVLMSLWSVAEEPSVMLVEDFFRHLKERKANLEALTLARKEIRKKGYDHPFYWAAFILVGDVN